MSFETAEGKHDASSPPGRWALVAPVYDFRHDLAPGYSVGSQFVRVETIIEVTRPDGGVLRIARDPGTGPSNRLSEAISETVQAVRRQDGRRTSETANQGSLPSTFRD